MPQQRGPARPGRARQISRLPAHAQPGQQREGGRLNGLHGPAQRFAGDDFHRRPVGKLRGDGADQGGIGGAATCQYNFVRARLQMQAVIQRNGTGGEFGQGRHLVEGRKAPHLAQCGIEKRLPENFSSGAFRRWLREVVVCQPSIQQPFGWLAARRPLAVSVHRQPAAAQVPHGHVNKNIPRTGVEGQDLCPRPFAPVQRGDIADAAKIVDTNAPPAPGKDALVKQRGQGRALPAGHHVRRAKVADHRRAQRVHQISRFAQLQCCRIGRRRVVKNGLAVQADEVRTPARAAPRLRMAGVKAAQVVVQLGEAMTGQAAAGGGVQGALERFGKTGRPKSVQPNAPAADFAQRVIDAVDAGAGHDSQDKALFHFGNGANAVSIPAQSAANRKPMRRR